MLDSVIGAGCAAKMSSSELNSIVSPVFTCTDSYKEDANSFTLSTTNIVQSVDIISPIIDNPYFYGQIAVTHALSDIYAMGATPATALNICCFPAVNSDNEQDLQDILLGAKAKLKEAYCICLGGHTVVDDNIKYGLSVTGTVSDPNLLTRNCNLRLGDSLILTKPIGIGLLVSLLKLEYDTNIEQTIIDSCTQLNNIGQVAAYGVCSMTDITGFGLVGHLLEMAKSSQVSISLNYDAIPVFPVIDDSVINIVKDATRIHENYVACEKDVNVNNLSIRQKCVLFDPQTSGGLVIAINKDRETELSKFLESRNIQFSVIGSVVPQAEHYLNIV